MDIEEYKKIVKLMFDYTDDLLKLYPETERFNLGFRAAVFEIRQEMARYILQGKKPYILQGKEPNK